jgi:4-carboxymuconolactone decarboxylase
VCSPDNATATTHADYYGHLFHDPAKTSEMTMQNETGPRVKPLLPPEWDEVQLDALGAFPKSLQFVLDKWKAGKGDVRGMNVLGTMAYHPALTKAYMTFNAHVAGASSLDVRTREIAILRLSWLRKAEYEYVQHIILGLRAGLTHEEIERIEQGPDAAGWSADDADILRAADELCANAKLSKPTWDRLSARFSLQQVMDLIFIIGCYEVLAMAVNSFNSDIEPGVAPLDTARRERMFNQK